MPSQLDTKRIRDILGYQSLSDFGIIEALTAAGANDKRSEGNKTLAQMGTSLHKNCDLLFSATFALPEIVYGVSLVFSPHVLLFSILFYVHAFEAPHLTSMEDLRRLLIEGDRQEMLLPLKKEMDDYYVFPKVEVICGQP